MAGKNGALRQAIRLPDLSPESVPIVVDRDGEEVTLAGYVSGKRCPIPVTIAQATAYAQWDEAKNDISLSRIERDSAYLLYVKATLGAVVPGLKDAELDVIAGDDELRESILIDLKWWVKTAGDADPEATGEETASPPTTAGSSPDSAPSTTAPTSITG